MGVLEGRVAVVTGGTAGIGLATARRFIAEGAFVFVTGRRQHELDIVVAALGANACGVQGDAADLHDIARLADTVGARKFRVDVLFCNAGGGQMAPLGQITPDLFDATFDLNVRGTVFTVQAMLPILVDGASVILTGAAVSAQGQAGFGVYGAAKAALRHFARAWTVELAERRIRVNVLSPGPVRTPGLMALIPAEEREAFVAGIGRTLPAGRVAEADEIAAAVLFLASEQSSYITGTELFADGGAAQV